ncbi:MULTISPECIES: response regulator [Spirosoma]|uniref:Response regulator n=1 Tax=Spirosoma liriopis TaxID=2937440 RepID=A0ABT0HG00_9BACT|nr:MULTISPECIES: response regulator [Spirosoma]MCK8491086.1 response regulator [Spirosoma liriopis]UHG90468.1 response regulator [Spirosoma oryzicola]
MIDVLYIEDDANDADIFSRLMEKLRRPITYSIFSSGSDAIDYLAGQGQYTKQLTPLPKLLLLDLNLMGLSGFEVIQRARQIDRTRFLPIVAFSTSDNPQDIQTAYEAGINAYVVKPGTYQATGALLGHVYDFWLESNTRIDNK